MILTIGDLADRWQHSVKETIRTCREQGVPFIPMRRNDMRVNWMKARFRLDAIEAWEREKQVRYGSAPEAAPAPEQPARKFRHLGNF